MPVDDPDEIETLSVDKHNLPNDRDYMPDGYVARQVVNIKISRSIKEFRAEVLKDDEGNQYLASFPPGVTRPIQYGASVKAKSTYLSNYQLIPVERVQEQFKNEHNIPLCTGSISNFNREASNRLLTLGFDKIAKHVLTHSPVAHADETSINLSGNKIWLHNISNENWTWFEPHASRGTLAMNHIGVLPLFNGVLCHDHWNAYYTYQCEHSLCNAHHIRELTRAFEHDDQEWAEKMRILLLEIKDEVAATDTGALSEERATLRREQYREILSLGEIECPERKGDPTKKRRPAQTKSRCLLERLQKFEDDVLRFMVDPLVPFTNNQGERDIRMVKVQQKISGCFRSMRGATGFCRVRSYLSTCEKNNLSATEALEMVFNGKLPDFMQEIIDSIQPS